MPCLLFAIFQDVARLTVQSLADGLECGESHGLRLARLQNREVRLRDTDLLGQFLRRHLPPGHHHVYIHYDTHTTLSFLDGQFLLFFQILTHQDDLRDDHQPQACEDEHRVALVLKNDAMVSQMDVCDEILRDEV